MAVFLLRAWWPWFDNGKRVKWKFYKAVPNLSQTTKKDLRQKAISPWIYLVAGRGFEPLTFGLWARRATRLLHPASRWPHYYQEWRNCQGGVWALLFFPGKIFDQCVNIFRKRRQFALAVDTGMDGKDLVRPRVSRYPTLWLHERNKRNECDRSK